MNTQFAEDHIVVNCTTESSDIFATAMKSDIYSMQDWRDIFFVLTVTSGGTGTARCHLRSLDAVSAATTHGMPCRYRYRYGSTGASTLTAWTLATSSGFLTTADCNYIIEIWGRADDLYVGDKYIMFDSTEVANDPVGGTLCAIFTNGRYQEDIQRGILT